MANYNPTPEELSEIIAYNFESRVKMFDSGISFSSLDDISNLSKVKVTAALGENSRLGIIFGTRKAFVEGEMDDSVADHGNLYSTIARVNYLKQDVGYGHPAFKICDWSIKKTDYNIRTDSVAYADAVITSNHLGEGKLKLFTTFCEEAIKPSLTSINFSNSSNDFYKPYLVNLVSDENDLLSGFTYSNCYYDDLKSIENGDGPFFWEAISSMMSNGTNEFRNNTKIDQAFTNGDLEISPLAVRMDNANDDQDAFNSYHIIENTFLGSYYDSSGIPYFTHDELNVEYIPACAIDVDKLSTYFASNRFKEMKALFKTFKLQPEDLKVFFLAFNTKYNTPIDYDKTFPKSRLEDNKLTISSIEYE